MTMPGTAKAKLFKICKKWLAERARNDNWDEDVTKELFEFIRQHYLQLYNDVVSEHGVHDINRMIGRIAIEVLKAEVLETNGKRAKGSLPEGEGHLIQTYTKLRRPEGAFRRPTGGGSRTPTVEKQGWFRRFLFFILSFIR